MPKLVNKNPKLGKLGKYAVVRLSGQTIYLKDPQGRNVKHGTAAALTAHNRFCLERQSNPTGYVPPTKEADATVKELGAAFLDYLEGRTDEITLTVFRIIIIEFLVKLYGDTPADEFSTTCLDLVRTAMKQSQRFNRNTLNRHTRRIISVFKWGVWKELCEESTWQKLTVIPPYKKREPGTFEGKGRKPVADDVMIRTIKHGVPTEAAMIKVHRLTGARSSELCNLTVGAVDLKKGEVLLTEHKTKAHVGERTIALRPEVCEIIAPYLIGKKPENAVFSPRQVMDERYAAKRAKRKSKVTPSQAERARQSAEKAKSRVGEFYNSRSYCKMVKRLIAKANRAGENIPHWTPYQLRHSSATADAMESILKMAMERLGHTDTKMTENYAQVKNILENMLMLTQDNPFEDGESTGLTNPTE